MGFSLSFTLFFVVTTFYVVIVDVFTMLFRITGLTATQARFQTISLLTNSGYTTQESELVVDVMQRRRLARTIMLFGYVFNITVVSVFVNMMLQLPSSMKAELWPVLIIVGALFVVFIFVRRIPVVRQAFNSVVEQWGRQWMYGKEGNSIMLQDEYAHGVLAAVHFSEVPSILKGKSVQEWNLGDDHGIYVVYINRGGHLLMRADEEQYFQQGDLVTVYGDLETIRTLFGNAQQNRTTMPKAPRPISEQEYIHNEDVKEAKEAARQAREKKKEEDAVKTSAPAPHEEKQAKEVLEQIKGILLGGPGTQVSHATTDTAAPKEDTTKAAPKAAAQGPVLSEKPAVAGKIADLLTTSTEPRGTFSDNRQDAKQSAQLAKTDAESDTNAGKSSVEGVSSGLADTKQSAQTDENSAQKKPSSATSRAHAATSGDGKTMPAKEEISGLDTISNATATKR